MQSYLYANDHGDKDSFALSRVLGAISRSVEATERVAADGTLRFVQDVASVVLAGLIQFIRNVSPYTSVNTDQDFSWNDRHSADRRCRLLETTIQGMSRV